MECVLVLCLSLWLTKPSSVFLYSDLMAFREPVVVVSSSRPPHNEIINFQHRSAPLCWWDKYEFLIKFSSFFRMSLFPTPVHPFASLSLCCRANIKILKLNSSLNGASDRNANDSRHKAFNFSSSDCRRNVTQFSINSSEKSLTHTHTHASALIRLWLEREDGKANN